MLENDSRPNNILFFQVLFYIKPCNVDGVKKGYSQIALSCEETLTSSYIFLFTYIVV